MSCKTSCRLCPNLVISSAIAYDATTNTLNITIPDRGYRNCEKVCIVLAQAIPTTTTINAQVFIFVGASSFPLVKCDCTPVLACEVRTRTRYSTQVVTNTTTGSFRLLGNIYCQRPDNLEVLPVTAATTATVAEVAETRAVRARNLSSKQPIVEIKIPSKKEGAINE